MATREKLRASDLAEGPIVLPQRADAQSVISSWFGARYAQLDIAGTANLNVAGEALVRAGVGRSIQIARKSFDRDLVQVPLDPPLTTGAVLVWLREKPTSHAAKAFAQFVREKLA